jgi:hypothetical protein
MGTNAARPSAQGATAGHQHTISQAASTRETGVVSSDGIHQCIAAGVITISLIGYLRAMWHLQK